MTDVPFTQFLRPDGRKRDVLIGRPDAVAASATEVIKAGGRFEIEELQDGTVSMTVEHPEWEADDLGPVAFELCDNGPAVPKAVDRLVEVAHFALVRSKR